MGVLGTACALFLAACGTGPADLDEDPDGPVCELPTDLFFTSTLPDEIPSLLQPPMVTIGEPGSEDLLDSDRILGVVIDGQPRAYPHNILVHHEIVSDRVGGRYVTATFCPLTGSGLAFDPSLGTEQLDIGVSGLLFANNLVLYDRISGDVYGPQLSVDGKCSRFRDQTLSTIPMIETSWGRWRTLHPNTRVVSRNTGFDRNYDRSPYEGYEELNNDELLFEMTVDDSRPIKERVLAIRAGSGGVGYPFGELADELGSRGALNETVDGTPTAIFYEADQGQTAIAFYATVAGQDLTFDALPDGTWTDFETGSIWTIDGTAIAGSLQGERLAIREDAFVVFWFAWRHFQPNGVTWVG